MHELTERFRSLPASHHNWDGYDYLIRTWLKEKAHELFDSDVFYNKERFIYEVLGLDVYDQPKEPQVEKWCEHIAFDVEHHYPITLYYPDGSYRSIGKQDIFCPICGTPRPKEKSLAEKFHYHIVGGYEVEDDMGRSQSTKLSEELAYIAHAHYTKEGG